MAEEKAAAPAAEAPKPAETKKERPTLFIVLAVFNMLIVAGVGVMLYLGKQKEAAKPTLPDVIEGEHKAQVEDQANKEAHEEFIGTVVPMEMFLVNLAGARGGKIAKVMLELEVDAAKAQEEIEKRKPQIRDIIIIILSSKTYDVVTTRDGKEQLREEIRDTVNSFLTKGRIKQVFFTEFIVN